MSEKKRVKRKKEVTTITIHPDVRRRGQEASREMFGDQNLSGYVSVLIDKDCQQRKIK